MQSSWTIMLYPHWWMKNQKVLYDILVPMTLLKQIMIDNVNVEDLAQPIVNVAKKCRWFGVNNIAISSILMRKNMSINKIIKKVNEEISRMSAANGFHFICNGMIVIDVSMIWKDGLNLTNDGNKVLANHFLKYLKRFQGNIDFNVNSENLMD